ncbi:MAG: hypothetical protein ACYDG2_22950 [Ruminiclostridium sp.]
MSKFKQLNNNITKVMSALILNQNICKLVTNNNKDALSMPNIEDTSEILYQNIFPYNISLEAEELPKSFVCVALDDFRRTGDSIYFSNNKLVFNVLVHNDLWRIEEGLRPFCILDEIDKIFCNEHLIGIGKMIFESGNLIYAKNYTGYRVAYKITDFNTVR